MEGVNGDITNPVRHAVRACRAAAKVTGSGKGDVPISRGSGKGDIPIRFGTRFAHGGGCGALARCGALSYWAAEKGGSGKGDIPISRKLGMSPIPFGPAIV